MYSSTISAVVSDANPIIKNDANPAIKKRPEGKVHVHAVAPYAKPAVKEYTQYPN